MELQHKLNELQDRYLNDIEELKTDVRKLLSCPEINEKSKKFLNDVIERQITVLSNPQLKWMFNLLTFNKINTVTVDAVTVDAVVVESKQWAGIRAEYKKNYQNKYGTIISNQDKKEWAKRLKYRKKKYDDMMNEINNMIIA